MAIAQRGNSDIAYSLEMSSRSIEAHLESSTTFSKQAALNEVAGVWETCHEPDWDGYGAEAIAFDTVLSACCFIEALPWGYALPSVAGEADGAIELEWYRAPNWVLSVSLSPDKMIYYVATFGTSKQRGSDRFAGSIPTKILDAIAEFIALDARS